MRSKAKVCQGGWHVEGSVITRGQQSNCSIVEGAVQQPQGVVRLFLWVGVYLQRDKNWCVRGWRGLSCGAQMADGGRQREVTPLSRGKHLEQ